MDRGFAIAVFVLFIPSVVTAQVPNAPSQPSAIVTPAGVTLTWTPSDTGAPATRFRVVAGTSADESGLGSHDVGAATTVSAKLMAGTYIARVIAINDLGESTPSKAVWFVIDSERPGPPTNVVATSSGADVAVRWDAPTSGGQPLYYEVIVGTVPGGSDVGRFNVGAVTSVSAPLTGDSYFVRVVAVNGAGESVPSEESEFARTAAGTHDGTWQGMTSQGVAFGFIVVNQRLRSIVVNGVFNNGTCSSLTTLSIRAAIDNLQFSHSRPNTPGQVGWSLQGAFSSTTAGSGSITMTANPSGSFQCSGTITATWTVQNYGVGAPYIPRAPSGFAASAQGSSGAFTWTAPSEPPVSSYVLELGRSSGASDVAVYTFAAPATTYTTPPLPSGTYFARLRARNSSGTSPPSQEQTFAIDAGSAPLAPANLAAAVSGASATLTWSAATSGAPATSYDVEIGTTPGGVQTGVTNTGALSLTTSTLPAGTYYSRVRARNSAGVSPASNEVAFTIAPAVPGAPSGLQGSVSGSTASFTWSAPTSGGPVSSYELGIGTSPGATDIGIFTTTGTSYTTGSLAAATYYARVRARNSAGVSPASNEVSFTIAPPVPGAPASLSRTVNGSTITFTWSAPTSGGTPTSYDVEIGTSSGAINIGVFTTGATTFTTGTLAAGTYYARVRARNASGAGPASNEVSAAIAATGVPGPPVNLTGTINGSTVTFTWSPPTTGGTPTSYIIEAGTSSGASDYGTDTTTALSDSVTLPNGTYFVRVRARNTSGTGPASNEVTVTIGTVTVPGAPSALTRTVNGSTVTFSWSAPTSGGTPTSYDVQLGTSSGASNVGVFSATALTYTTGTLAPGTYFARVRARNAAGTGSPSNEVTFTIAGSGGGASLTFAWDAPADGSCSSFDVEIGTSPGSSNVGVFNTTQPTYTTTALASGTYYVRVRGRNALGVGQPSNEVMVTVPTSQTSQGQSVVFLP